MATSVDNVPTNDFKPRRGQVTEYTGRLSFVPKSETPGPAAYNPRNEVTKARGARGVFGTATRDHEQNRFISQLHQSGEPPRDTPGPAEYRCHTTDARERNPKNKTTPAWGFGSARQRPDDSKLPQAKVPGPIYQTAPVWSSNSWSFAPPGDAENGMSRTRDQQNAVFISKGHAAADRSAAAKETPGPQEYELVPVECESPKRRAESVVFGKSSRDVLDSLPHAHIKADPMCGTSNSTPGPVYEYGSSLDSRSIKFGTSPKFFSPEAGGKYAGPYLSKGHESSTQGTEGPGPGAYNQLGGRNKAVPGLGSAPTYKFGTERIEGSRSETDTKNVPGPGAYNPKEDAASRAQTAPSYSMGSYSRAEYIIPSQRSFPGPGQYEAGPTTLTKSLRPAAFSMGITGSQGRSSFVPISKTPGAGSYTPKVSGCWDSPKKGRGFSFGVREKTINPNSTVSVRYQGPLGQAEGMGSFSPGPGMYNSLDFKDSNMPEVPKMKFGSSSRQAKVFLSKQHAEAEGHGTESPGPGTYNFYQHDLADVTSRYPKPPTAAFATSARFKSGCMTF